jgi:hypothetical protein
MIRNAGTRHATTLKSRRIRRLLSFAFREASYLRLRAALRAAFLRARVRAPLRAEALRAALLPLRGAFFFAAAICLSTMK